MFADRVKETTSTTGSGNITLAGAATGFQSFNAAFGLNQLFAYCIELGAEWEIGRGYLSDATTMIRDHVEESSNADALVNFGAGAKNVFCTVSGRALRNANVASMLYNVVTFR